MRAFIFDHNMLVCFIVISKSSSFPVCSSSASILVSLVVLGRYILNMTRKRTKRLQGQISIPTLQYIINPLNDKL